MTNLFEIADVCLTVFVFLNQVQGLKSDKVSVSCDKKVFDHFWSKIWLVLLKNQVFGCFLENRLSEVHVT